MLTRSNYNEWALLMRVNLQAQGLWHALELEEGGTIEYREDRLAFAANITICAPRDVGFSFHQAHRTIGLGGNQISSGRLYIEQLRKELSEIRFKDGESVDDFLMRITGLTGLANSITTLGGGISETEIVKKMLQVVPNHLEQVAISIETLLDVNDLAVEEVTGRLRNVEQRKKNITSVLDKEAE